MLSKFKTAYILSILIALLATAASAGGLLIDGLYRDNFLITSGWLGNDLVTLVVAVPLLVGSMILSMRGARWAQLVWLGMLDYSLYNFAFYLFGTAFNAFFMLYVALFALSIFALIFGLARLNVKGLSRDFRPGTPVRWIAGWMLFVALGLTVVYTAQWASFLATGQVPEIVTLSGHVTNVVFALDLSLVVPVMVLGGVWLWQRRPWGYALAAIANVKGALYMLALTATNLAAYRAGAVEAPLEVILWVILGLGSLAASAFLLGNLRTRSRRAHEPELQQRSQSML